MSESPEHNFLKTEFLSVLNRFSALELYGYNETSRRLFDLSCTLKRDWHRPLIGQVLWGHEEGIEKDLRSLLHDDEADIKAYIARSSIKNRQAVDEILSSYRKHGDSAELFRLKVFWAPPDFDADEERQRKFVANWLTGEVISDILFNVAFGRISARAVDFFLDSSGAFGLNLAVLHRISTEGFLNIAQLAKRLSISPTSVREKLLLLKGASFISNERDEAYWRVTESGRVFLDILARLAKEHAIGNYSDELMYVLGKLGCPVELSTVNSTVENGWNRPFGRLVHTLIYAQRQWGCSFDRLVHILIHPAVEEAIRQRGKAYLSKRNLDGA